jgi:methyl-accepting chemotaxis protein
MPLGVVSFFFYREIGTCIAFADSEHQGVVFLSPVERLLQSVVATHSGGTNSIGSPQTDLEAPLADTGKANDELGVALKAGGDWQKVDAAVKSFQSQPASQNRGAATDSILGLITTVGNNSQLVLDPDIDSYYTMDQVVVQIPNAWVKIGQARDMAAIAASKGTISNGDRTKLTVLKTQIESDLATIHSDFKQAGSANHDVKKALQPNLEKLEAAYGKFASMIDGHILGGSLKGLAPSQVLETAQGVFTTAGDYLGIASHQLDRLLATREAGYSRRRTWATIATLLLLIGAGYLFIGFHRSTIGAMKGLASACEKILAGDLAVQMSNLTRDEVGDLSTLILNQVRERFGEIVEAASRISMGDLAVEIGCYGESDQLGVSLNAMVVSLQGVIGQMAESAAALNMTSNELKDVAGRTRESSDEINEAISISAQAATEGAVATEQMAEGCDAGAKSAAQAADSMKQLKSAIALAKEGVDREIASASEAVDLAKQGDANMSELLLLMDGIRSETERSVERVRQLGTKGNEVGAIVKLINDIAEQTNLLALNAAIEAARAGEHGRGFAVVADEVGKLAQRSAAATREISGLIAEVQAGVKASLEAMEASTHQVEKGARQSRQTAGALRRMIEQTVVVTDEAAKLGETAKAMDSSSRDMESAVESVAAVSEETAASAEELSATTREISESAAKAASASAAQTTEIMGIAASAEALQTMARDLSDVVDRFTLKSMSPDLRGLAA